MFEFSTTIAAISTPPGNGGIGIVRLSGKDAINIADKVFEGNKVKSAEDIKTHTVHYGKFINNFTEKIIDEGLILVMKEPNTYTRENIVEFHCHGSYASTTQILNVLLKNGATLAQNGEFTKRAFLNGRIDLAQAEAVMDIINSKTVLQLNAAMEQLKGNVSKNIKKLRENIISIMAHLEAFIDFPEDDIDEVQRDKMIINVDSLIEEIDKLLRTFETGKIIREGISVSIVGRTNVGKSSFLNQMLNENKAIVTEIEGTTRDVIEDYINLEGVPVKIVDTAGIRETEDLVEKIGINRSKEAIEKSQIVLLILDISKELTSDDMEIIRLINDKPCIVLLNKADKENIININKIINVIHKCKIIKTSMVDGQGIEEVKNAIVDIFKEKELEVNNESIITNERHKDSIYKTKMLLEKFKNSLNMGVPEDIAAIDLRGAANELGVIVGEVVTEDILDEVFSKFCVGK